MKWSPYLLTIVLCAISAAIALVALRLILVLLLEAVKLIR